MERVRAVLREIVSLPLRVVRPAVRSLRDNSGLAVLSVVLAFGLWIVVTDAENPTRTRVLPVDLEVQPVRVEPDVAVSNDLQPVRVRVRVEDNVFESLTAVDFEATIDLDGLTVGVYDLPVEVEPRTSRGGLRIEEVLPNTIEVRIAQLVTKRVPVVVNLEGEPPSDYDMSSPEVEDESVDVSGPQERVEPVTQVTATVNVDARTDDVDQAVRLEPRDQRGNLVLGVSVNPPITEVHVDIDERIYTRAVVVVPTPVGTPAPGYNLVGTSVNPVTVTVSGSKSYIEGASVIYTQPIDVDGADEDLVKVVALELPTDVTVIGNVNVTVTVQIAPFSGRYTVSVPVSVEGLGNGLSIAGGLPTALVVLEGSLPILLDLEPGDVTAAIDLAGKTAGTQTVAIEVTPPPGIEVVTVNPVAIEVVLEAS